MIGKENIAVEVDNTVRKIYSMLEGSIRHVNENASAAESEKYRHAVGKILYTLVFDLWEPLYQEHPRLKPADWDDHKPAG
jgi:hypothetical protein